MQRRSILIPAFLGVFILTSAALPAFAAKEHGNPAQSQKSQGPKPPPIPTTQQVIKGWCVEHPDECRPRSPGDPRVNKPHEVCVDRWGNDDGYLSPWELNKFGQNCYEQN